MSANLVTTAEARSIVRLADESQDTLLGIMRDGAEDFVSGYCSCAFESESQTDILDGGGWNLIPYRLPLRGVTSVTDLDTGVVEPTANYWVRHQAFVLHRYARWGAGEGRWQVVYTGGYGGTVPVPAQLKLAVLQLIARAWDARGGLNASTSAGVHLDFAALADSDIMAMLDSVNLYGKT